MSEQELLKDYQQRRQIEIPQGVDIQQDFQQRRSLDFQLQTKYDHKGIHDMVVNYNSDQEVSEDDAERMIKLYFASESNRKTGDQKRPEDYDYEALVHSQFGDRAPQMKKADVFKMMQKMIVPEPDEEYKTWKEFSSLTDEEKWERIKPEEKNVVLSPHSFGTTNITPTEPSEEEKKALIAQHEADLRGKSSFAIKAMGKAYLSPRMQKLAFDIANGVPRESMAFEFASPFEQQIFPSYVRSLNPEIDVLGVGGTLGATWERMKQMEESSRLGRKQALYSGDVFSDDLTLNLKMQESDIIGGYDFANGKWFGDEAKERAQAYMDRAWEEKRDMSASFQRHGIYDVDKVDVDSPEFHQRMQRGNQDYQNKKWSRMIDQATQTMFDTDDNLLKDAIIEGGGMTMYMLPMMASSAVGGAPLSMFMSGSEFYGRQVDDLVYDHGVNISDATKNALITSIPYSMMEQMQIKFLTGVSNKNSGIAKKMVENFPAWLQSKPAKIAGDLLKGYTYELSQEFAQAGIERLGRLYAMEFQEAEGITFDGEMKSLVEEMVMASKAMILPVIGGRMLAGADIKGGAFANEQEARNIQELYGNLDAKLEKAKDVESNMTPASRVAYNEAQTTEERQSVLDDYNTGLTVDQVQQYDEFQSELNTLRTGAVEELKARGDLTEQQIDEMVDDRFLVNRAKVRRYAETVNKYADIEQIDADNFLLKGKDGGAEVNLNIVEQMPQKGAYDPKTNTITLPRTAEDFTFTHEISHAMRDLKLIDDAEWNSLVEYGTQLINQGKVEGYDNVEGLKERYQADEEALNHEIVAHAMEQGRREGAPVEVRNIAQRAWDFFTSLIGYTTQGRRRQQITQDVFEGKPMARKAKIGSRSDVSTSEIKSILSKALEGDLVSQVLDRSASEINREFDLSEDEKFTEFDISGKSVDDIAQDIKELNDMVSVTPLSEDQVRQEIQKIAESSNLSYDLISDVMIESNVDPLLSEVEYIEQRIADLEQRREQITEDTSLRLNVIENLPKIDPKSLPSNLKKGVKGDIPIQWLSKDGVSIDEASRQVWENLPDNMREQYNDSDVKNIVEEVIQQNKTEARNEILGDPQEIKDLKRELRKLQAQDAEVGGVRYSIAPQEDSEAFKNWSGGADIIEDYEIHDHDFKQGKPVVMKLYHGTTHADKLFEFRGEELGNKEGHFGAVNYFTSSEYDAETNYLSEGTDLTNRIDQEKEKILNEIEDQEIGELIKEHGTEEEYKAFDDWQQGRVQYAPSFSDHYDVAERLANAQLKGSQYEVLELYVRVDNPVVIGGARDTEVQLLGEEDLSEFMDEAKEQLAEEQEVDESDLDEWEVEERARELFEENGYDVEMDTPFQDAVEAVSNEYDFDPQSVFEAMMDFYESASAGDIDSAFRNNQDLWVEDPETGGLINSHVIGQVFKELGYDAIILKDADQQFSSMDMVYNTTHVHIFDKDNAKIKSATENVGSFDPTTSDIRFSLAPPTDSKAFKDWFGDSKMVDKDGSPIVFYHGSSQDFNEFKESTIGSANDAGFYGRGFYFTFGGDWSKGEARSYGENLKEVYLKIENPFDFSQLEEYEGVSTYSISHSPMIFLLKLAEEFPQLSKEIYAKKRRYEGDNIIEENIPISELKGLMDDAKKDIEFLEGEDRYGEEIQIAMTKPYQTSYTDYNGEKVEYETQDEIGKYKDVSDKELEILSAIDYLDYKHGISAEFQPEGYMTRNPKITEAIRADGHDGIIQSWQGDEAVVFSPTQIKSATDNVGTYDPSNADIRYSLEPLPQERKLAVIALADRMLKGNLTDQKADEIMQAFGIEDRESVMADAKMVIDDMDDEIKKATNKNTLKKAIRTKANQLEYRQRLRDIQMSAREGGEIYERARKTLQERRRVQRERDYQKNRLDSGVTNAVGQNIAGKIEQGDDKGIELEIKTIKDQVREMLIKEGLFTARKKHYEKDPAFRSAYGNALTETAMSMLSTLPPSRRKTSLMKDARNLRKLTSTSFMDKNFAKFLDRFKKVQTVEDKNILLKRWNKLMNSSAVKEQSKSTQEIIRSKFVKDADGNIEAKSLHPKDRRRIQLIKHISGLSIDKAGSLSNALKEFIDTSSIDSEKALSFMQGIDNDIPKAKAYNFMDAHDKALVLLEAVKNFGALKHRSPAEIADALAGIEEDIQESFSRVEDIINEKNARVDPVRDALEDSIGKRSGDFRQFVDRSIGYTFDMRSWFDAVVSKAPESVRPKAKEYLDDLLGRWNSAIQERDIAIMNIHNDYFAKVEEIYGEEAFKVIQDLEVRKDEYRKFSKENDKMSKGQIMQLYASAVQQDYIDNAQQHGREASQYLEVLTGKDLELIEWYRDYYAQDRDVLSAKLEEMTGIPIDMQDPLYVPVKVKSPEGDLPVEINVTKIIPDGMIQRVKHQRDFDDTVSINQMWMGKVSENEHFKYVSDVSVDMRSIFSSGRVQETMSHNYGNKFKKMFLEMVQDNINDGYSADKKIEVLDKVRGFWTASKFALNLRIGLKQVTSIPAFGFEVGLGNTGKYLSQAWTSEGRQAMREILDSEQLKQRIGAGNSEAVMNSLNEGALKSSKVDVAKWTRKLMVFNIAGDVAPTLLVGQGIYRSYVDQFYGQGETMAKSKEMAMKKLFQHVESSQQSSKLKDWSAFQRRYGSLGRMMSQFTNTTRQFLVRDFTDVRNFIDQRSPETFKKMSSTLFINHVLLPAFYNGMNMLINMILGDEPDEDDWWMMFASMVAGPASGFIIVGSLYSGLINTLVTGKKPFSGSNLTAFEGIAGDVQTIGMMTEGILTADSEQFINELDRLMKSLVAPYREYKKYDANN